MMQRKPAIIFFDGHCHLCCNSVQFILDRDKNGYFNYAPNEGKTAASLFQKRIGDSSPDSIVLFEHDKFYFRSTAALRIARKLSGAWPILYIFMLIPSPVRDWVYNIIANNRYRWFGRMETCWMPKPEWKEKFLD
jgi:predicted DCC family thiol-disulfide oxidoreductase YuxK